ncbi:MAG: FtsL-like putative cell division protein [Candidatus Hatepunaea meridiana]|nr:FtsL-like putative cell division protein [Candidatus Hatepunaea meridiana]
MSYQKHLPQRKSTNNGRSISKRSPNKRLRILLITLVLCLLGCFWIAKGNYYTRVSEHTLTLEKQHRELEGRSSALLAELSELSQFTRIERLAKKLGMVTPQVPPDTIYYENKLAPRLMGTSIFFGFK